MEVLTVVLAILADAGFGRRCQVTVGNKEICLEDAEALGFLREEDDKSYRRRWTDPMMTRDEEREPESLLALGSAPAP